MDTFIYSQEDNIKPQEIFKHKSADIIPKSLALLLTSISSEKLRTTFYQCSNNRFIPIKTYYTLANSNSLDDSS